MQIKSKKIKNTLKHILGPALIQIRHIRWKIYLFRLKISNLGKDSKKIFSDYWVKNHWNNKETKSGDGSTLLYTEHIRKEIPILLNHLHASSILDAPCGDFNWFKEIKFQTPINYIGADIVDGLIFDLNRKFGNDTRKFISLDVIKDSLPDADIWMCRDLIFHLPNADVFNLIDNFTKSNIKYLLITSHATEDIKNKNTFMGGFRLINLLSPPFSLPEPDARIKDYIKGSHERYLLLYKREALRAWKIGLQKDI